MLWFALRSVFVFALAGIVSLAMRRKSASMRHLVWLAAFVAVAAMPVFAGLKPIARVETSSATAEALAPVIPLSPFPRASRESLIERIASTASTSAGPASESYDMAVKTYAADLRAEPLRFLPVVYGIGVAFLLLRYALALFRLGRVVRRSERTQTLVSRVRVRTIAPGFLASPATFGWPRATVLMPAESEAWPPERRHAAFQHELAHVERLDWVWQCLALVVCTVQWFNPLAWFAAARLRAEAEGAADDAVMRDGVAASDYAQELLEVAKGIRRDTILAVPIARPGGIAHRVRAILARDCDRSAARRPAHLAAGTGTFFLASILGGLGLSAAVATPGAFQVAPQSMEDGIGLGTQIRLKGGRFGLIMIQSRVPYNPQTTRCWDAIGLPAGHKLPEIPWSPEAPGRKVREFVLMTPLDATFTTRVPKGAEVIQSVRLRTQAVVTVAFPPDAQVTDIDFSATEMATWRLDPVPLKPVFGPNDRRYWPNLRWFAVPLKEARYRALDRKGNVIPVIGQWFRKGDRQRLIAVDASRAVDVHKLQAAPMFTKFYPFGPALLEPARPVATRKDAPIVEIPLAGAGKLKILTIQANTPGIPYAVWTADGGAPRQFDTSRDRAYSAFRESGYLNREVAIGLEWPLKTKGTVSVAWRAREGLGSHGASITLGNEFPAKSKAEFKIKPEVRHVHAQVGYAFAPWQVRAQEGPGGSQLRAVVTADEPRHFYDTEAAVVTFLPTPDVRKLDFDIEAFDARSKPLQKLGSAGFTTVRNAAEMAKIGDQKCSYYFRAKSPRDIAQIRLKVRTMHWVELPPLPMHPR